MAWCHCHGQSKRPRALPLTEEQRNHDKGPPNNGGSCETDTVGSTARSTIEEINTQATFKFDPNPGFLLFVQPPFSRAYFDMSTIHRDGKTIKLDPTTEANKQPTTQREVVTAIQNVVKGGLASSCTLMDATDIGTRSTLTRIRNDEDPKPRYQRKEHLYDGNSVAMRSFFCVSLESPDYPTNILENPCNNVEIYRYCQHRETILFDPASELYCRRDEALLSCPTQWPDFPLAA